MVPEKLGEKFQERREEGKRGKKSTACCGGPVQDQKKPEKRGLN